MRHACLGLLVAFLVVASVGAQEIPRMTVFPQIAVGGAWSSDFFVTNQGFTTVQDIELDLFGNDGSDKVVSTPEFGSGSVFTFDLAPGATQVIHATAGSAGAAEGFAELFAAPGSSLRATMVVRYAPGGQTAIQLGIPEQYPFSMFSVAAEVNATGNTALAICIPTFGYTDVRDQQILVSLANTSGSIIATKTVNLNAGEHTALFLRDLFTTENLNNFNGRVLVFGSDWLGVASLRLEASSLGTVAVDEGAALSPFFLNQTAISEVEPNNDTTTAQALTSPAVVSGVISSASDVDYFSFTGTAGQIVSIMTDTQSLATASQLDSELSLLNAQGEEIAHNDQNGTRGIFENDSLIRMVLPATGTYRIRLFDYRGQGGANYTYKLHVKVQ